jgi:uncharacterized protein DUF3800
MLAFIDESGDCGLKFGKGSSAYFTCVVVMFEENSAADACDHSVDALRASLQRPRGQEFHFTDSSDKVRARFLETVAQNEFHYAGLVINKRRLSGERFQDAKQMYEFTVGIVCDQVRPLLDDAKIIIDKNGDRAFRQTLEKSLKAQMTRLDGTCRTRKVTMESSHSNNLVQVADMICGAVGRSFTQNDDRFRKLVRRREKFVQEWTG